MDCVPVFQKNTNPNIKKACSADTLTPAKCLLERESETTFYDVVDWSILRANIRQYVSFFLAELNKDIALVKQIEELYEYGPLFKKNSGKLAVFDFKIIENDDYKHCANLILKILLNRGITVKGKQKQVLCHISLHPKLPKYYRDTRRSRSGCGYYKKLPDEAVVADEDVNSPFGYTIESLDWKGPLIESNNPNSPWLPFLVDTRDPGMFRRNLSQFDILSKEGFTDGRSEDTPLPDLELVGRVHKGIYNKFIDTWNNKWLPGVPGRSSAAGEVLEEALPRLRLAAVAAKGGTRKRRNRRYRKTRRAKRLVAHKH